ncbi:MAG TPA: helix-turn-helix transcriptional regulator [bacterium]|jgi:DNA-binding XRE family transcriptional regulator|nr:helix-turn-helix transcriptional regulator [bacterium]MDX9804591.1 helix-turn-helix transcriptional regulator [bacterium]HNW15081.1 helix-turn-helix transcriptional regulator [bacterium]HNZ52758.1 helix-turn-helix transcriptional regulator [bacterium]HOG42666.1 helix-turn-helix transcriptional regulator [bacterium]
MVEKTKANKLKDYREERLISKTELARNAEISLVTLDRIEKGFECRLSTKRKIIEALGLDLDNKDEIFPDDGN